MLEKYLKSGMKLALAVSGGKDSMVMLDKILKLKEKYRLNIRVINVNHKIREESDKDSRFVKEFCEKKSIPCDVFEINVPDYAARRKISTETAAREMRYDIFHKAANDVDFVCLAHHVNDNAETVLMHILRGSGARGASGIQPIYNKFFRPLLDETREEIDLYAKENNIPFVYDETNEQTKYTRNFVRHEIMPLLNKVNPYSVRAIVSFADSVKADDEYLNTLASTEQVVFTSDSAAIPKNLLLQPEPLAVRVLYKCFNRLGVYKDIEKKHISSLLELVKNNKGEKTIHLPFGYKATKTYDELIVAKEKKFDKKEETDTEIPFKKGQTKFGEKNIFVLESQDNIEKNRLIFDIDKLPQGVVFRTRRDGDIFKKYGGGTKKLKEFFIDKKIPKSKRDELILGAKGDEVFFVLGVEISDKIKKDASTKRTYTIFVEQDSAKKE